MDISQINEYIAHLDTLEEKNQISDGYHTFGELYSHRVQLYILVCALLQKKGYYIWRSEKHHDDSQIEGMFVMGINTEKDKQISYHMEIESFWKQTNFADTLEQAPHYDLHNSDDVLERLQVLLAEIQI